MNPKKHKFELKYDPGTKKWSVFDDGVVHSEGYESREEAQKMIDSIVGGEKMSQKEIGKFFKKWKHTIKNHQM
jgi:hypothetical protein